MSKLTDAERRGLSATIAEGQTWRGRDGAVRYVERVVEPGSWYADITWRRVDKRGRGTGYLSLSRWWHTAELVREEAAA